MTDVVSDKQRYSRALLALTRSGHKLRTGFHLSLAVLDVNRNRSEMMHWRRGSCVLNVQLRVQPALPLADLARLERKIKEEGPAYIDYVALGDD